MASARNETHGACPQSSTSVFDFPKLCIPLHYGKDAMKHWVLAVLDFGAKVMSVYDSAPGVRKCPRFGPSLSLNRYNGKCFLSALDLLADHR